MNTDAAVPGLNRNNVYRLETIFSSIELINAFSKIANSLKNEFDLLLEQSNHLSKLRDSLLPKLLSGEIELSEIQSEVA
jgi:type I restriction enzyme, S subunit